jgi:hypothetical protein
VTCRRVDLGNGFSATVCTRERPRSCRFCGRSHLEADARLCDEPLRGPKAGQTCDAHMCSSCAMRIGENLDLCPPHAKARVVAQAKALAAEQWLDEIAPRCSVCGRTQLSSPSGPVCPDGHGAAPVLRVERYEPEDEEVRARSSITWHEAVRKAREADARRKAGR